MNEVGRSMALMSFIDQSKGCQHTRSLLVSFFLLWNHSFLVLEILLFLQNDLQQAQALKYQYSTLLVT